MAFAQKRDPEFTTRDVTIGVAIAAGCTIKEAAEAAELSERWIYEHIQRYEGIIERVKAIAKPFVRVNQRQIKQVARDKAMEEIESLLGPSFAAWRDAIDSGDLGLAYSAGKEVRDRLFGKPAANLNVNQSGRIDHVHQLVMSAQQAQAFALDAEEDVELHSRARSLIQSDSKVIDV